MHDCMMYSILYHMTCLPLRGCFCVQEEQLRKQVRELVAEVSSLRCALLELQAEASNTHEVQKEQIMGLQELVR